MCYCDFESHILDNIACCSQNPDLSGDRSLSGFLFEIKFNKKKTALIEEIELGTERERERGTMMEARSVGLKKYGPNGRLLNRSALLFL